jgi:anti-sigma factor RsiW
MNGPCKEFADRIVDYVDGELPEGEAQAVARHLATCEPCRRTAQALNRSLGLAKALWFGNLDDSKSTAPLVPAREPHPIRFYAVAAGVLVAASILMVTMTDRRLRQSSVDLDEVERQVIRAGMAAELLAATRIVARCEGTESIVERQYRYILREYADTPAAKVIRADLGSGGTQ